MFRAGYCAGGGAVTGGFWRTAPLIRTGTLKNAFSPKSSTLGAHSARKTAPKGPLLFCVNSLPYMQMPDVRVELTRGCPHRILRPVGRATQGTVGVCLQRLTIPTLPGVAVSNRQSCDQVETETSSVRTIPLSTVGHFRRKLVAILHSEVERWRRNDNSRRCALEP